jgi:hypothetical protein
MQRSSTGVCAREILLNQKSRQMDSRFDPHMYAAAVGLVRWIANPNMVMFDIKSIKLKERPSTPGARTLSLHARLHSQAAAGTRDCLPRRHSLQ